MSCHATWDFNFGSFKKSRSDIGKTDQLIINSSGLYFIRPSDKQRDSQPPVIKIGFSVWPRHTIVAGNDDNRNDWAIDCGPRNLSSVAIVGHEA